MFEKAKLMNKVKKFMIENKIYVLVLFLGIIAIIYGMMSLYDMFKEHSLIYFITINGIIVATIYVGIHEQKRRNEFTKSDLIYYALMQIVMTSGLSGTFILMICGIMPLKYVNIFWGLIIVVSIVLSEFLVWKGFRFYFKKKRKIDLLDEKYHSFFIHIIAIWFTFISFVSFLVAPFMNELEKEMGLMLSIGSIFCFYDLVLSEYQKIKGSR